MSVRGLKKDENEEVEDVKVDADGKIQGKRGRKGNFELILGAAVDSCSSLNWYFECECAFFFQ